MGKRNTINEKRLMIRNLVIAVLVIAFFSGIILMYYNMLYNESKSGIIKSGELAAKESADYIENYLSTNTDYIKLVAYTLDDMLKENRTDAEIQDYLVGQSVAVRSVVAENMTGLYGYINGRFFSGTNWEPPADFDAKKRPWYQNAMEHPGEIAILEPYLDVQSGNFMLALGKTLSDGVSVISVDVSFDQIQKLTEEAVRNGYSDIQMILSDKGMVVAHSDINEIGKNYFSEKDTIGSEIASRLTGDDSYNFEFDHDGSKYIVYVAGMQNDWVCVSVKDATRVFGSLNAILLGTILVVIAIVIIISVIMTRSSLYLHMSAKARAASEAKSEFLSKFSHEIRTPINTMLGMNEMIIRESKEKSIKGYAQNVKDAGKSLLVLIDEILDFSKKNDGENSINLIDPGVDENNNIMKNEPVDTCDDDQKQTDLKIKSFVAPKAKILVVDDNPMNLMVFKNLLKRTEVITHSATTGNEGISLSYDTKYDLIFLDHMMPEKDGIETLHEIRDNTDNPNRTTPVICLTANAVYGAREEYMDAGFDDYLSKPIDPEKLEQLMMTYLPEKLLEFAEVLEEDNVTPEIIPDELLILNDHGIDVEAGVKNAGSVLEYMSLLRIFFESIGEMTNELTGYFEAKDFKNYTIKIHALKSSSRIIGAVGFSKKAQKIENAGKAEDYEYIKEHGKVLLEEFAAFGPLLSGIISLDDNADKPEAGEDLINMSLEEIKNAAEEMDCDRLEAVFDEIGEYRIPGDQNRLFAKLKEASSQFDYDAILSLLKTQ